MSTKELTRQELLQIYYNEALELLFNQEHITTEWLTKIKEKRAISYSSFLFILSDFKRL